MVLFSAATLGPFSYFLLPDKSLVQNSWTTQEPGLIHGSGASDSKHEKTKRTITKPLAHVDWARVECWTAVFYAVSMASVELESL